MKRNINEYLFSHELTLMDTNEKRILYKEFLFNVFTLQTLLKIREDSCSFVAKYCRFTLVLKK